MACKRLVGRIAIVTASTDGIGRGIAERLAKEGAKVIVSSRKQKNVDETVKTLRGNGLEVTGLVCHVGNTEDRKKLFEEARKLGGLDILVSNAAANPFMGNVLDTPAEAWDKIFEINVRSSFLLAKESLPLLRQSKVGRIIFIGSLGGLEPMPLLGAYSVSKTALLGLTKAAAAQLASDGITVNSIAPGIVKTKFAGPITTGDAATEALSRIPLNRYVYVAMVVSKPSL